MNLMCKRGSVGQSEGLSIPRSSVRFRLNPNNSNSHGFELHRLSNKGTKLLLKVIKAIIIIISIPTPSKPYLCPSATMSDDTLSTLTPPLHCASILQPAVVAF